MKLTIDYVNKEITILEDCNINEFLEEVKNIKDFSEFKIKGNLVNYIPYNPNPWIQPFTPWTPIQPYYTF